VKTVITTQDGATITVDNGTPELIVNVVNALTSSVESSTPVEDVKKRKPYRKSRLNKMWTPDETNQTIELFRAGKSVKQIAAIVRRTESSVSNKLYEKVGPRKNRKVDTSTIKIPVNIFPDV